MAGNTSPKVEQIQEESASSWPECRAVRLRPQVHFCRIGARFILLDLAASRYFLLEGPAAERFTSWCDEKADASTIRWLQEAGLVEPGSAAAHPSPPVLPLLSLFDVPPARARPWLVAEALCEQVVASRRVRGESLAASLRQANSATADLEACRPIAAACRAAARYRAAADQCLPNALAMRRMLARRGIASNLVIGVMLPFSAHCWLQSGETVLSDPLDSVRNFHPLVVV
ncbi:lasso peptide biosynthesis B2 protein [Sphingopyxis sp. JAI108]|uniref:lasso peptide biosynthesis B2 protein n=1 Tax=Sphingopyxis sp. JAI108 TaxID=2723060 RepID=UPI0015CBBCF0|nr:lasso peptide biosynthesis B2 protein [Sphingopyxis sp. JAI108]NYF30641.1 hypothetical protein [Sphingopyxis sp. JAI108]